MNIVSRQILKWREKYVDTLAKLYEYSTTLYERNRMSEMLGSDMGYTYGSFRRKCDEISARLSRYGIGAGDRVAILSQNMPNWTVAMFSLVPFGRISVPISEMMVIAELRSIPGMVQRSEIRLSCFATITSIAESICDIRFSM